LIACPNDKRHVRHGERLIGNLDESSDGKVTIQRLVISVRDDNVHRVRISLSIGPVDHVALILNPVTGGRRRSDGDGGDGSRGQQGEGEEGSTHRNVGGETSEGISRRVITATWPRASIQAHLPGVDVLEAAEKGQDRLTLTPVVGF